MIILRAIHRLYFRTTFSMLPIIFIIAIVFVLMQKHLFHNHFRVLSINLSPLYTLSASSEQNRTNELLKSYSFRYKNSVNDSNQIYSLTDTERNLFNNMMNKLHILRTQLIPYPKEHFHGRGVVLTVGLQQIEYCKVNLKMLEISGTQLPIQIWYSSEHVSAENMLQMLFVAPKLDVSVCCFVKAECRRLTHIERINNRNIFKPNITGSLPKLFPYKPAAIISSTFAEVLFLDCDSYVTRDPEELFLFDPMYLKFGALFFPDGYQSRQHPFLWKILNTSFIPDEYELDSAAILVDKRKVWNGLYMTKLMNDHHTIFYTKIVSDGDKDTFRLAFRYMQVKYYIVMVPCTTGSFDGSRFCGHTLCKTDSLATRIYINHVHLFKYDPIKYSSETLGYTRIGVGDPNNNQFYFQHCILPKARSSCFHLLEKVSEQMNGNRCYLGNVTLAELDDEEYTLKKSIFNDKKPSNRVLMSRTNNLMPNFVTNLIKYSQSTSLYGNSNESKNTVR